jgi:hypothetical protein
LGQGKEHLVNDYMTFCSNFNGTWDQYIDVFSDGLPNGSDTFWYSSTKYPKAIPITPFKDYIRANQVEPLGSVGPMPQDTCRTDPTPPAADLVCPGVGQSNSVPSFGQSLSS